MKKISVIIPTYQEGSALPNTLRSILNQTYKDIEILLIDDGSTDNTEEQVKPFLSQIQYYKRPHQDRQPTRNFGLAQAKGEYVIVCDADIQMKPDCLEKMAKVLNENPSVAFVYSSFRWGWKKFRSFPFDVVKLREMNYINMASLVRTSAHPGFDESIGKFQDWDVWLTIVDRGGVGVYIPEELFSIGEHREGMSRWLPSMAYKVPFIKKYLPALESYDHWKNIIQEKHRIK